MSANFDEFLQRNNFPNSAPTGIKKIPAIRAKQGSTLQLPKAQSASAGEIQEAQRKMVLNRPKNVKMKAAMKAKQINDLVEASKSYNQSNTINFSNDFVQAMRSFGVNITSLSNMGSTLLIDGVTLVIKNMKVFIVWDGGNKAMRLKTFMAVVSQSNSQGLSPSAIHSIKRHPLVKALSAWRQFKAKANTLKIYMRALATPSQSRTITQNNMIARSKGLYGSVKQTGAQAITASYIRSNADNLLRAARNTSIGPEKFFNPGGGSGFQSAPSTGLSRGTRVSRFGPPNPVAQSTFLDLLGGGEDGGGGDGSFQVESGQTGSIIGEGSGGDGELALLNRLVARQRTTIRTSDGSTFPVDGASEFRNLRVILGDRITSPDIPGGAISVEGVLRMLG